MELVNGTESDRDAEFVFSSSNGLMDPDFIRSDVGTLSLSMYHIDWGLQTTHAGGGACLSQFMFLFQHFKQIRQVMVGLFPTTDTSTAGFFAIQFEDSFTKNSIEGYTFDECKTLHQNGIRQLFK
ncbi:unnamed protein product [Adineta steineri]|uniref:Uncharacterized protein n=1 Tax=Adineta steineri TaxID=433720 RepID=A0A815X7N0_9BILA|nr:unnamed protein product [Adineta steineri]CAF1662251.1 unnamed protein product [Adineta steineri]